MKVFGIIGKPLKHSFSPVYFNQKFKELGLHDYVYRTFELANIFDFEKLCRDEENLIGLNVTIPYKEEIFQYLDEVDTVAKKVGAVNTITFHHKIRKGYNTDVIGFEKTIEPILKSHHKKALILGTGGSSKAVKYVFTKLGIEFLFVSSKKEKTAGMVSYNELNEDTIRKYNIIVNCTPVGMFPAVNEKPVIPYNGITSSHLVIDLIYNPAETLFLQEAYKRGATISNGYKMLVEQAEASWKIWNSE
jgi:shikimate dehydrogenase